MAPVVVLIPAYRPAEALVALVRQLCSTLPVPLIVVDDGSGPAYQAVFAQLATLPGVLVVRNGRNLGKGGALKTGINAALVQHPELVGLVTADADGQHAPADIVALTGMARSCPAQLGLGYRCFDRSVPLRSRVGNQASCVLYRLLLGIRLRDTQTGLRYLPRELAERSLEIAANGYAFETEQLILAARLKLPVCELPIQTIYASGGQVSHFSPFFDSLRIYFVVVRYALTSVTTTAFDFLVFALALHFGAAIIAANLISRSLALVVQYSLLKKFVFRHSSGPGRFLLFVAYVLGMGFVSGLLQNQLLAVLPFGALLAKAVIELAIYVFNFLFLRDILFSSGPS